MAKKNPKDDDTVIFRVIALIVLFWCLLDMYLLIKYESFYQIFWFCNVALLILALGFYFRNPIMISLVLIAAIALQVPWLFDFLVRLIFAKELFGVANYMFKYGFNSIRFYAELNHLIIIPLAAYGTIKLGLHKRAWLFGVPMVIVLNALSFIFSSYEDNVNCVFYSCFSQNITLENKFIFMLVWTAFVILLIYIANCLLLRIKKLEKNY